MWPFDSGKWQALWTPFAYFGIVCMVLFLWVAHRRLPADVLEIMAAATSAGVLGSLWFWIEYESWYFSLIHGVIWGCAVGLGLSHSGQWNGAAHRTTASS